MMTEWFLAKRYLFRGRARHISFIGVVSCVGIALGTAALIIVISVMNGFDRDLTERLLKFNYHITVDCSQRDKMPQVKEAIKNIAGVKEASLFVQTQVFAKFDDYYAPLMVKGMDFDNPGERNLFLSYAKCPYKKGNFYLGAGLRRRFFVRDIIEYYPLDKKFILKEDEVAGFFKVGIYDIDNNFIITDIDKAKSLSPNYMEMIGLRLQDPFKAQEIKERIHRDLGEEVFLVTWAESNQVLFSALKLEKIVMFLILSLIILVASFNIFATLTVKVVEKTKDIGILKALGFTSRRIMFIFSLQGFLLGVFGVLSGGIGGLAVCFVLKTWPLIKLPESIYAIERLPVNMNLRDIALIMFLGILLSLFSSFIPAFRASKLEPCDALRYE